jgi:hypothetical protein
MMRRWRLAALFVLLILTACGDSTGPAESIFGTYTLRTIDGVPLPYVWDQGVGYKLEITDAALSLEDGGTYSQTLDLRDTRNGTVSTQRASASGTFTYAGTTITFRTSSGTSGTASLSGGTLTFTTSGGGSQVYVK